MDPDFTAEKLLDLQRKSIRSTWPIASWQVRTAEYLAAGRYRYDGNWRKADLPCCFVPGKTVFFKSQVTVPASLKPANTYLQFEFEDMQGLLSIAGLPFSGIDLNHQRVRVPRTGKLQLLLEFMSVPVAFRDPEPKSRRGKFAGAQIRVIDPLIEGLYYDLRFALETAAVTADEHGKLQLEQAVEEALAAVDLDQLGAGLERDLRNGREIFRRKLKQIAGDPGAGRIFATGHTHIDTAWLWPIRETVRKCARTFSSACRLMEKYKDFYFSCSQPQLYDFVKLHYPSLYRQIKRWVRAGRWETTGAMWVEADCNITSGEALIRQILYGLDFFKKEFGTRPRACWLPDVFGYSASLPEILRGCGIPYFFGWKLHFHYRNPFPYHLFRWRGLDGSEVLAHMPKLLGYNGRPWPENLAKAWNEYVQKSDYPEILFTYGYGDGGGGPNEEMQEMVERASRKMPGLPLLRTGPSEKFFDGVAAANPDLPVWDGELYLELHRGTFTTQAQLKRANRRNELLLRDAEIFGSLSSLLGKQHKPASLRKAWETLLLHQFHDILPGSSIGQVYRESLADQVEIQKTAQDSIHKELKALAPGMNSKTPNAVCVFNSLSWPRRDLVSVTIPGRRKNLSLVDPDGGECPAQIVRSGKDGTTVIFTPGEVPAMGYATYEISNRQVQQESGLSLSARRIENNYFLIRLNRTGGIISLYDKVNQRECIAKRKVGNDLQLFRDSDDAWNIPAGFERCRYAFDKKVGVKVIEAGPVRGVVRISRTYRKSSLDQDITVYAGLPRIDFVTRVNWHERKTLLKASFPLEIRARRATCEIQFGAVERATHRNTSWEQEQFEVPAQRWVDLSESGYGVSLLNDCKYGHDIRGNVVRLTLLRGTTYPDPDADQGYHEFTYSLYPHAGTWVEAETVRRAWELNVPSRALSLKCTAGIERARSYISLAGTPAIVETFKVAEDGRGYILRIYEPNGGRGKLVVSLDLPVRKVVECNLVEEGNQAVRLANGSFRFEIRPFQIRTFRIITGRNGN